MSSIDGDLRPLFRKHIPQFDWTTIESGTTGGGIPDSNFCFKPAGLDTGIEGWVEYKVTSGWTVPLRPEQVGWIMRRVRHGGRVWVAVRQRAPAGPRRVAVDALWVIPGALATVAKAGGLRGLSDAAHVWHHGPGGWDWGAVARVLAGC